MQRIEPDAGSAKRGRDVDQVGKIGEIAMSPVPA
jgi:hypothetical protein